MIQLSGGHCISMTRLAKKINSLLKFYFLLSLNIKLLGVHCYVMGGEGVGVNVTLSLDPFIGTSSNFRHDSSNGNKILNPI
jgi:hypothetical protein